MPTAQLSVLVKLSGGFLPPNSRAGDIEIYDNGLMRIFESDTAIAERQIGRQKVVDILTFARNNGFFTFENVFHDQGTGTAPDVTINMTDQGGSTTVTATAYQKLRGEMRKNPFDVVYKYITNVAWESYNSAPETPVASNVPAPAPTPPAPPAQVPPLAYGSQQSQPMAPTMPTPAPAPGATPAEPKTVFDDLPSLDELLKQDQTGGGKAPSLPPLQSNAANPQTTASGAPGLPSINSAYSNQPGGNAAQPPKMPPLQNSKPPGKQANVPPLDAILKAQSGPQEQSAQQRQQAPAQQPKQQQPQAKQPDRQPPKPPAQQQQQQQQQKQTPPQQPKQQQNRPAPQNVQKQPQPQPQQRSAPERPPVNAGQSVPQQPMAERPREKAPQPMQVNPAPTQQNEPTQSREASRPKQEQPVNNSGQGRPGNSAPKPAVAQPTRQRREPPVDWQATQDLLSRIESALQAKAVVVYIRKGNEMSTEVVTSLYRHLRSFGQKKHLVVIPVMHAGEPTTILRMSQMLRSFGSEVSAIIPEQMSMLSTLLALGMDHLLMNDLSYLVPIEVSFSHPSLHNGFEDLTVPLRDVLMIQQAGGQDKIDPLALAAAQRSDALIKMIARQMISLRKSAPKDPEEVVKALTEGYPTSDYPIVFKEAKGLGLPVEPLRDDVNDYFEELLAHYDYITHPFYDIQNEHTIRHAHAVIIETVGKRTVLYEERLTEGNFDEVVEEHTRWRQLTEELSLSPDGKEQSNLRWKELAIAEKEQPSA